MEPERWQRLWTIFHGALERPPGGARAAYLDEACGGDSGLRGELDALIAAHAAGEDSLPGIPGELADRLIPELVPGTKVGPYRIVRSIGEGGMGLVYEASQEEPVRRRVALKLLKPGLDTREVVRRFEAERQALARMDHSSIAKVFDAGATAEGRPYFAMELVDGPALTRFCDRERLPLGRRLELAAAVCRAVHHAHQKGVIHRDLKPGNVLIATEEGRPVPKVIDFGIARAVDPEPGTATERTRFGQLVGTPEAMSPEQAEMGGDVDTRTDVYALGALIYELTAGVAPFDFGDTAFPEMLRRIREEEPASPSLRLVQLGDAAVAIAAARGTDLARLRRALAGELDWIVARAMAKEREHRYGSAAELADDLERHLTNRPIAAGPPSRIYRLRKLVRRHRVETAAAGILLVALLGFGIAMAAQSRRLARSLEIQQQEQATSSRVSELLVDLLEQPDPAVARGAEVTVRQALDQGAEKITRELSDQPEVQARLLETIGRVYLNLGLFDAAEAAIARALELRRALSGADHLDVASNLHKLGEIDFEKGHYDSARARVQEALAMRIRLLGERHPAVASSLDLSALLRRQAGDLEQAERLHQRALEIRRGALGADDPALGESWNYLGIVRRQRGELARAETAYRQALGILRSAHGEDHPKTAMAMNNLALVVHLRGYHAEARRLFEELVPLRRRLLGPEHPDFLITLANQAKLLHDMGELEEAARTYEGVAAVQRRVLGADHPQLASVLADLSGVLAKRGRLDAALAAAEESLAIRQRAFGPDHSTVAASLTYLAQVHAARGELRRAAGRFSEAIELHRRLGGDGVRLAQGLEAQGRFLLESGDPAGAEAPLAEAVALLRPRLGRSDRRVARAESTLGGCLARLGRLDEAEELLVASLRVLESPSTLESVAARRHLEELRTLRSAGSGPR